MRWVAGVDGCPGGWVVALRDPDSGELASGWAEDFAGVLALPQDPSPIAVDVPIGLLSGARPGGRECDRQARKLLGRQGSSVFSAPSRPALEAVARGEPYRAVSEANRASSPAGIGLSKQSFAIMPKIADVDEVITPTLQGRVFEVHPEVSFHVASGGRPLPSKRRAAGRTAREEVLRELGYPGPDEWFPRPWPPRARADDLLDACIACWTAARIGADEAVRLPASPAVDARGLRMEIWS